MKRKTESIFDNQVIWFVSYFWILFIIANAYGGILDIYYPFISYKYSGAIFLLIMGIYTAIFTCIFNLRFGKKQRKRLSE